MTSTGTIPSPAFPDPTSTPASAPSSSQDPFMHSSLSLSPSSSLSLSNDDSTQLDPQIPTPVLTRPQHQLPSSLHPISTTFARTHHRWASGSDLGSSSSVYNTPTTAGSYSGRPLLDAIDRSYNTTATAATVTVESTIVALPSHPPENEKTDTTPPTLDPENEDRPDNDHDDAHHHRRHPTKLRRSLYTRFFRLEEPETRSKVIVQSSWLWTGALFSIRCVLFVYTFTVLLTDLCMTDRPQFEFCYLTQLSYLGLTSYLGTVSWHTFSEWRRERALRAASNDPTAHAEAAFDLRQTSRTTTTIERQHWLLTDMNFFLYHTICTFHVIVPLLYWSYTSYEGEARLMALEISSDSLWRNYSFHGGDLIVVMIEVLINTMPFIPSHLTIVFFISLLYLAEAHIVHHVNGFWIYPFLDTSVGPIWLALYVGVGFVIMCAFCLMFYIHRLRNWIRARGKYQQQLLQAIVLENSQQYSSTGVLMGFDADPASLENEGGHDHDGAFAPYAAHPQIMAIQNQNRKRSDSDSSNYSTTSTLVGSDEDMGKESVSRRTSRKLQHSAGVDSSPAASGPQLEVVEEES